MSSTNSHLRAECQQNVRELLATLSSYVSGGFDVTDVGRGPEHG